MNRGKIAIVTGATSGIGEATALKLATAGYDLILTGRRAERLEALAERIRAQHRHCLALPFDVRDEEAVKQNLGNLPEPWNNIDLLINNAGLSQGLNPVHEAPMSDFNTMMDTNVKGLLHCCQAVLPGMQARKQGHIINVSSIAGKEVYPNGNVYCASKHAVEAISKSMRMELLPFGIKVSTISPGLVETEFSLVRFHGDEARASQVYQGYQPLSAADVADAIHYVATAPEHVNIADILILPKAQASSMHVWKG